LHPNGSLYIIMGHTNLRHVLNAAEKLCLNLVNHIIWKFNFGVYTQKKFVTSHYHVLYYSKSKNSKLTFNTHCRYGSQEKDGNHSLLYQDLEDVFCIKKEYSQNKAVNQNKLPEELIRKLIQYSSRPNDLICDFFMGNFTTAYSSLKLGRRVCGFEVNKAAYDLHMAALQNIVFGMDLAHLRKVENIIPKNQGLPVTEDEARAICNDYKSMLDEKMQKKKASQQLQEKYQRGRFSIKNILDKWLPKMEVSNSNQEVIEKDDCHLEPTKQ
jgi:site-specific DNA-methyltransferase (adenine-specific)